MKDWPDPVRNLEELKSLAQELCDEFEGGEWYWDTYSCITASVEKGHIMDDSILYNDDGSVDDMYEDERGYALLIRVEQPPNPKYHHGDELHHPIPRKVAKFVEVLNPAFVLRLIDGTVNRHFDEKLMEENDWLRRTLDQRTGWMIRYRNRLREAGLEES